MTQQCARLQYGITIDLLKQISIVLRGCLERWVVDRFRETFRAGKTNSQPSREPSSLSLAILSLNSIECLKRTSQNPSKSSQENLLIARHGLAVRSFHWLWWDRLLWRCSNVVCLFFLLLRVIFKKKASKFNNNWRWPMIQMIKSMFKLRTYSSLRWLVKRTWIWFLSSTSLIKRVEIVKLNLKFNSIHQNRFIKSWY